MPRAKNKDKPRERDGVLEITPNYFRLRWREPDPANPGKTQRRIEFFHGTRKEAIDERIRLQGQALGGKSKPRRKTLQDLPTNSWLTERKKAEGPEHSNFTTTTFVCTSSPALEPQV